MLAQTYFISQYMGKSKKSSGKKLCNIVINQFITII